MAVQETKPPEAATTGTAEKDAASARSSRPFRSCTRGPKAFLTKNISRQDGRKRDHVPPTPVWMIILRIAQLLLAVATMVLTAWGINTVSMFSGSRNITNWSGTEGYPFTWFAFSWTTVYLTWLGLAVISLPIMYNCWVHLALEMLTVVFWLITTALLASHSDDLNSIDAHAAGLEGSRRKFFQDTIQSYAASFIHATYAATGTAAANFILFVVTLVCFGRTLHNIRVKAEAALADAESSKQAPAGDQMVAAASPQMTAAGAGYPHWPMYYPHHPHPHPPLHPAYPYFPQAGLPSSAGPSSPDPSHSPSPWTQYPHPYMSPYFAPPSHDYTHQQQTTSPTEGHSPQPPPLPYLGPPGTIWPQHSYAMYQQQVPIAAQHTGQSQPAYGSPQFPMVAPVALAKPDMPGVGTTPTPAPAPTHDTGEAPRQAGMDGPAELRQTTDEQEQAMPAELPSNEAPNRDPPR